MDETGGGGVIHPHETSQFTERHGTLLAEEPEHPVLVGVQSVRITQGSHRVLHVPPGGGDEHAEGGMLEDGGGCLFHGRLLPLVETYSGASGHYLLVMP
jgi:hypothetical protein